MVKLVRICVKRENKPPESLENLVSDAKKTRAGEKRNKKLFGK